MSTESLQKDHKLIEKVLQALDTTIKLLKEGKQIPEQILLPTIDFTQNFTNICHHGKEEEALFPALEKAGMPSHMGPIRMMIVEHQRTTVIAGQIELASKKYLETDDPTDLILTLDVYVQHVREHLWKENNRLFKMAEARLNNTTKVVDTNLAEIEEKKLQAIGKSRSDYETLADDLEKSISEIN